MYVPKAERLSGCSSQNTNVMAPFTASMTCISKSAEPVQVTKLSERTHTNSKRLYTDSTKLHTTLRDHTPTPRDRTPTPRDRAPKIRGLKIAATAVDQLLAFF